MRNQLRNIFNSKVSEISILLIICALIVTNLSTRNPNGWTDIAVIASIAGGLILLFLLVWVTIKLTTKKEVKEMPLRTRITIESISRLLFLYWIYIAIGLIPGIVWAVFIIFDGVLSFRQLNQQ